MIRQAIVFSTVGWLLSFGMLGPAAAQVAAGRSWGPEQAAGPPNTPRAGDISTAWASRTQDGQDEWLECTYKRAVIPVEVLVHETFNPGAVHRVSVIDPFEREKVVWEGKDPTAVGAARGVSKIRLKTDVKTNRIRIYLKSREVKGWNEIDAVGLVGRNEAVQWADKVTASSTYADLAGVGGFAGVPAVGAVGNQAAARQLIGNRIVEVAGGGPAIMVPLDAGDRIVSADQQRKERERHLSRLLKLLRTKDEQLKELAAENARLEAALRSLERSIRADATPDLRGKPGADKPGADKTSDDKPGGGRGDR